MPVGYFRPDVIQHSLWFTRSPPTGPNP